MTIKKILNRTLALTGLCLLACGTDERVEVPYEEGRLLPADAPYELTVEEQRLREMQYLRVAGVVGGEPVEEVWDLYKEGVNVAQELRTAVFGRRTYQDCASADACGLQECSGEWRHQEGEVLLDLARGGGGVAVRDIDGLEAGDNPEDMIPGVESGDALAATDTLSIPVQSAATRVRLAELAQAQFREALRALSGALRLVEVGVSGSGPQACTDNDALTRIAAVFGESLNGLEEAALLSSQLSVDVAESQLGSSSVAQLATARAMAGPTLSRASAAHLLIGGEPGLEGDVGVPLCAHAYPSGTAQLAIDVIRDLAPPAAHILAVADDLEGELEAFLNGPATEVVDSASQVVLKQGSLSLRYTEFHGEAVDDIGAKYGLTDVDFAEAVRYLAQEIRGYKRALRVVSAENVSPGLDKFAAVASPPTEPPESYWTAKVRSSRELDGDFQVEASSLPELDWPYVTDDFPTATADVITHSRFILQDAYEKLESGDIGDSVLTMVAAQMAGQDSFGFVQKWINGSSDTYDLALLRPSDERFYLAFGEDALRCAVQGQLEGQECSPYSTEVIVDSGGAAGTSLKEMVQGFGSNSQRRATGVETGDRPVYLLMVRPGVTEQLPGAGDFIDLTGFYPEPGLRQTFAIHPRLQAVASKHVRLAGRDCAMPAVECGGTWFDERLPLENELSEDGDGVESSWKYYLTQASNAAAVSDGLIREYIEAGLSVDRRSDELEEKRRAQQEKAALELERLQSICGTSVDIVELFDSLSVDADSGEILHEYPEPHGTCTDSTDAAAGFKCVDGVNVFDHLCSDPTDVHDGFMCIDGKQIRVWEKLISQSARRFHPELYKLQQCLKDAQEVRPYMQMGDTSLCYWEHGGSVCRGTPAGAVEGERCPFVMEDSCPSWATELTTADSFGWYETNPDGGGSASEAQGVCAALRGVRRQSAEGEVATDWARERVTNSDIFSFGKIVGLRAALEVEAEFGGFVTVKLNGNDWFSTGDMQSGPNKAAWPCLQHTEGGAVWPEMPSGCPPTNDPDAPFACRAWDCTDPDQRTELNERIIEAFETFEITTQPEYDSDFIDSTDHVTFWLPVLVPTAFVPDEYSTVSRSVFHPQATQHYWEMSNEKWKMYYNNGPIYDTGFPIGGRPMRWFVGTYSALTNIIDLNQTDAGDMYYSLAFGKRLTGAQVKVETIYDFYDGVYNPLSRGTSGLSYFADRIAGRAHGVSKSDAEDRLQTAGKWTGSRRDRSVFPTYNYNNAELCESCQMSTGSPAKDVGLFGLIAPIVPIAAGIVLGDPVLTTGTVIGVGAYISEECFGDKVADMRDRLKPRQLDFDSNGTHPKTQGNVDFCSDANDIRPIHEHAPLGNQDLWDSIELVCESAVYQSKGGELNCAAVPEIVSVSDMNKGAEYLECKAEEIRHQLATTILKDLPEGVVEFARNNANGDSVQGDIGQLTSQLLEALKKIEPSGGEFERIFKGFAVETRKIKARLRREDLEDEETALRFTSSVLNQVTACAAQMAGAAGWGKTILNNGSALAAASVTCTNSVLQAAISGSLADISLQINEQDRIIIFGDAETEFLRLQDAVANESEALEDNMAEIQRLLGEIEDLRDEARRSIDKAIWHLSFQTEKAQAISNVLTASSVTARTRYEDAHENAKKWASLARRAMEQRLGVRLDSLHDDMPLVEAPYKWANGLCASSAANYDDIATESADYADAYIGDYVTKLENVVESYRLQFGFQDGTDLTVASLRDDVLNVRAECEVPSKNLFYHATQLEQARRTAEATTEYWGVEGCALNDDDSGLGSNSACLRVVRDGSPFSAPESRSEGVPGHELIFADGESGDCSSTASAEGSVQQICDWSLDAKLVQRVELTPGTYRFSWYGEAGQGAGAGSRRDESAGAVWDADGVELARGALDGTIPAVQGEDSEITWARHYVDIEVPETGVFLFGFSRPDPVSYPEWQDEWRVTVGAPMLEVAHTEDFRSGKPSYFSNTTDTLTEIDTVCADTTGEQFRELWDYRCEQVCPSGDGGNCPLTSLTQCFHEMTFHIDQKMIERGKSFIQSGFARGNFNYRLDSVATNFVGTGLRDCSNSTTPEACYGAGFLPYSLYHHGPYYVRNHFGDDYEAYLFDGVIEHARGLAGERYVSNPISETDRGLLADYTRLEFQGRPMDGTFKLRIWDEPGVDFSQLEDVQVVLRYNYWSR